MSTKFSVPDAEKKIEELAFSKYVRHIAKEKSFSLDRLSLVMNEQAAICGSDYSVTS